jgi:hypothetical protein
MTAFVATRASLLSQHQAHLLAIGIPVLMVIGGLTWDSVRKRPRRPRVVLPFGAGLVLAAVASVAAAAVHLAVVPEHLRESGLYGAFFVGAAGAQLGSAGLLVRTRSQSFSRLVAAGNAAVIVLWLLTRLVGVPIGPDAGDTEPFQLLDVTASTCEALVIVGCVAAGGRLPRLGRVQRVHA